MDGGYECESRRHGLLAQTGTAKMGRDAMSVVDGTLKVQGIEHLRIADGATMPRVTAGTPWRAVFAARGRQISRCDLSPPYSNRTSLKSIATISISVIGRRSGPRV